MRLLHFHSSGRLALTDFTGRPIPPYAILSHRWGDFEVLFEDLGNDNYKTKKGYRKIEFCAERAAQDQLEYFWIDTCCIDKWNLRERSRAINSMFRWYKEATRCYVFLPDVSVSTEEEVHQQSAWEASFRASEWFTRGWTLQELIAPASVEFFTSEGWRIGDKRSLEKLIHEITSIPDKALQNGSLTEFSAADRIGWAKNRKATEEEDNAYCLLGILGIHMPSSYGEGKEKALTRLQIEMQTTSNIPSIIPFSQNDKFVGRESQLVELESKLFGGKETTMIAITGPGGTGKSQLALELAYRVRQKNSCSVFWIDASDLDSLHQGYLNIAQKLDVPGWNDEKADTTQLVTLYLSRKSTGQWLLIYDNTIDLGFGSTESSTPHTANLMDYLPQSESGSIVFTTTNLNTAKTLAGQNIIKLREMAPTTAERMLQNYLITPVSGAEQQEATLLLKELSYLPLAIVQAAAYINNTGEITLLHYRSQVMKQKEEALELSSELSEDKLRDYSTESPIAATLLISLDRIRHNHPLAAEYLFLAACVDRKDIPIDLLGTVSETEDAVRVLHRYALITRRPAQSALDLHRLVHLATRKWLKKQEWLGEWSQKAIARLLEVFPEDDPGNRSKWRRLLPHTKHALLYDLTEEENEDRTTLKYKCAKTLQSDGRYTEAADLFAQVLESRKKLLGDEDPSTLSCMANLALSFRDQGRWKEAEVLLVKVMETRKRVFEDEHPDTVTSMGNLALTYWDQGRWKEAEELEKEVIEARKRMLGDEHPDTLTSIANLALTYRDQGRWDEAEELCLKVIEIRKRVLGDDHPDTMTSKSNLALTYWDQGRWDEAEEIEKEAIETRKRELGDSHPDTLTSIGNLALTYRSQGRWKEAEELSQQVIDIRRKVLGEEHPDTLTSICNLALSFWDQGRWGEAEELEKLVIETRKRLVGEEHPDTLTSIANLGLTYRNQGRWKEAEEIGLHVIEARKRVLGEAHPDSLTSMANLALTYWDQGRWDEAEELEKKVMEIRKSTLGEEHPDTLNSIGNLALTYRNQGRWEDAERLTVQALGIRRRVLGDEHPDTLTSMANVALIYWDQERWTEAEELEEQVVEIRKRSLGEEHPSTLNSMANLSLTYRNQGRWEEAEALAVQTLGIRKRVFGDDHPETLTSMANVALIYWDQERWTETEELEKQVMEIRMRAFGDKHPSTLTAMGNLAATYKSQGRDTEAIPLMEKCVELRKQVLGSDHRSTQTSLETLTRWKMEKVEV
jgi:tetratricopeptide (TPR) repeat protein